jgi:hypothetical protein
MVTISATPIASMGISIQGMGAASLADRMRTRVKLTDGSEIQRRLFGR